MQRAHFAKRQLATRRRITPDKVAKVSALIAAAVHYSQRCAAIAPRATHATVEFAINCTARNAVDLKFQSCACFQQLIECDSLHMTLMFAMKNVAVSTYSLKGHQIIV